MMWHMQTLPAWLWSAQAINLCFAGLCLWAACGIPPRRVAVLSAILYLALALV